MIEDESQRAAPKRTNHEIGADLSAVSLDEIRERIRLLETEISRLEQEARRKEASRDAAAAFFRT